MESSGYVALSAQLAIDRRLSTVANNIANAGTVGYRAAGVVFNALTSPTESFETAFASVGKGSVNLASGGLKQTGNALDLAVKGDMFLGYMGSSGPYYSRDGRLTMLDSGELINPLGHPLLDGSGSPIAVKPDGGPLTVQANGTIIQGDAPVGQIGLFNLDLSGGFERTGSAGIVPKQAPETADAAAEGGAIVQGYIEESNVDPVSEMVRLIQVTRAFEAATTLSGKIFDAESEAIKTLGSR
jgi:flagellar basal-body rod protein FlgF